MSATRVEWHGARLPQRVVLEGRWTRVEPLDPARHADHLYSAAAGADDIWTYLAYGPFEDREEFARWLDESARSDDPLFFAIVDRETGTALGMASLLRMAPEHGVIEIGHIWFSPALKRTRQATEAIYLLGRYAFELGNRRFEWKCDSRNEPSRRAAARFGFVYEGTFRQHMVVKGRNRDTAWFSITDAEWPERRAAFEAWLDPSNFDPSGSQKTSLKRGQKLP